MDRKDIEAAFLRTISGFYLNACAKNQEGEAREFYDDQLKLFTHGFELGALSQLPSIPESKE